MDPSFRASDFEFLELLNNSDQPLTLTGLTVADEVRFAFPTGTDTILDPGQRLLLVHNAIAFAARYGTRPDIGGVYTGKLNNGGGRLAILTPGGSPVFELTYSDDWHPTTDGQGFRS